MGFTPKDWKDYPDTSTPITQAALEDLETRVTDFAAERTAVSVKEFGATGDGTTDDTTAVQAAIDAVNTAGGGGVFFPAGTYLVTGVTLYKNMVVQGEGYNSVIRCDTGNVVSVVGTSGSGNSKSSVTIRNLAIRGSSVTQANIGLKLKIANLVTIQDVKISDIETGILFEDSYFTNMVNVRSDAKYGLIVNDTTGTTGQLTCVSCNFRIMANSGVAARFDDSLFASSFVNCTFESNSSSYTGTIAVSAPNATGPADISFTDCDFERVVTGVSAAGRFVAHFHQGHWLSPSVMTKGVSVTSSDAKLSFYRPRFAGGNASGAVMFAYPDGAKGQVKVDSPVNDGTWTLTDGSDSNGYFFCNTATRLLLGTVAIDSTGVKTLTIAHGLGYAPRARSCTPSLAVNGSYSLDAVAWDGPWVSSVDATNFYIKLHVTTAHATANAVVSIICRLGEF